MIVPLGWARLLESTDDRVQYQRISVQPCTACNLTMVGGIIERKRPAG